MMRGVFRRTCPDGADLSLPQAFWELQPRIVVTTNYDSVLQWANPQARRVLNHQHAELADLFAAASTNESVVRGM